MIKEYNELHTYNTSCYSKLIEDFFHKIEKNEKRLALHINEVKYKFFSNIHIDLYREFDIRYEDYDEVKMWLNNIGMLCIDIGMANHIYSFLNSNDTVKVKVADWLKKELNFTGSFSFEEYSELPF